MSKEVPMKFLIASDLHGSAYYTDLVLQAFAREKADRLLLLGDLLYHGPRNPLPKGYAPQEVFRMLNSLRDRILCVRGNCDSEVDQMVLEFPILAESLLLCQNGVTVFATHGHVWNTENLPPLQNGDVLLHGHTHEKVLRRCDGYVYLNPGSAALPKDDDLHSFMLFQDRTFTIKDLESGAEWGSLTV